MYVEQTIPIPSIQLSNNLPCHNAQLAFLASTFSDSATPSCRQLRIEMEDLQKFRVTLQLSMQAMNSIASYQSSQKHQLQEHTILRQPNIRNCIQKHSNSTYITRSYDAPGRTAVACVYEKTRFSNPGFSRTQTYPNTSLPRPEHEAAKKQKEKNTLDVPFAIHDRRRA